jgi:hypothetical protein
LNNIDLHVHFLPRMDWPQTGIWLCRVWFNQAGVSHFKNDTNFLAAQIAELEAEIRHSHFTAKSTSPPVSLASTGQEKQDVQDCIFSCTSCFRLVVATITTKLKSNALSPMFRSTPLRGGWIISPMTDLCTVKETKSVAGDASILQRTISPRQLRSRTQGEHCYWRPTATPYQLLRGPAHLLEEWRIHVSLRRRLWQGGKITPAERGKCFKEGLCFYCCNPGHSVSCPSDNLIRTHKNRVQKVKQALWVWTTVMRYFFLFETCSLGLFALTPRLTFMLMITFKHIQANPMGLQSLMTTSL